MPAKVRGFSATPRSFSAVGLTAKRAAATRDPLRMPLVLSRVYWVKPQLVAKITYLTWTEDGLLRQTVYVGLRSDKPAAEVRRELPRKG
jgi:bifunctional non-homologous end joining protein LigD